MSKRIRGSIPHQHTQLQKVSLQTLCRLFMGFYLVLVRFLSTKGYIYIKHINNRHINKEMHSKKNQKQVQSHNQCSRTSYRDIICFRFKISVMCLVGTIFAIFSCIIMSKNQLSPCLLSVLSENVNSSTFISLSKLQRLIYSLSFTIWFCRNAF